MNSIFSNYGSRSGARPPAAVELSPQGVLVAALPGSPRTGFRPRGGLPAPPRTGFRLRGGLPGQGQPPVYAFEPLPAGTLVPSIGEQNLRAPEQVAGAIRAALGLVSPRTRSVTLVLPDTVVRVFFLDFDSLPAKAAEIIPILRFRLRKMVPFEVEHAAVSYQVLVENKSECRVLAAVIPGPVLAEYEAAVREAGYEPGAVLPTSLAALGAIDSPEPVLAANLSAVALTTSITAGDDLLLYRTLDLPEEPGQRLQEVQRGVSVAAAYYEDKLGARPRLLYYAGIGAGGNSAAEDFASWIFYPDSPGDSSLTVIDLAPRPETGAATPLGNVVSLAGVNGALAGASS